MKIDVQNHSLLIQKDLGSLKITQSKDDSYLIIEVKEDKKVVTFSIEKKLFFLLQKYLD